LRSRDAAAIGALLSRHRDPTRGAIRAGGSDISKIPLADLPAHLTVVDTERPWLLSGTLLDNLRLAHPQATAEQALEALRAAGADDVLDRPDALERPIGERGLRLSGGQRQRVAIAQALLARTAALVILEPTSALDAVTEATVVERLQAIDRPATLILTTSPPLLAACGRVSFVHDGRIRATASHPELISSDELYRDLMGGGR
ncbi:MAG: ABC transporter ATP-binding protein, partial [Actinomycetota bacterium]